MKIKTITIEGMHNVVRKTYTLDNLTYFYGKNGVGKSTILQAIQLAILGYIPGTAKKNDAIFKHCNCNKLVVTAILDDDGLTREIRRSWKKTDNAISASVEVFPDDFDVDELAGDLELPIFNFNEFTGMTANKLKDWFIQFLPGMNDTIEWESVFKGYGSEEDIKAILKGSPKDAVGIDGVCQILNDLVPDSFLRVASFCEAFQLGRFQIQRHAFIHHIQLIIEISPQELGFSYQPIPLGFVQRRIRQIGNRVIRTADPFIMNPPIIRELAVTGSCISTQQRIIAVTIIGRNTVTIKFM